MEYSICPICFDPIISIDLDRHANSHFEDEDNFRDFKLAHEIAVAPPSPPRFRTPQVDEALYGAIACPESIKNGSSSFNASSYACSSSDIEEKIHCLVNMQVRETFHHVEGGLILLLKKCLETDPDNSVSILSGHVDHFQSVESEDVGWGCGWRNIQMLSSHLLKRRLEAREVLYGGSGSVPEIAYLQRWLEIAWSKGYDLEGSDDFNQEIYGKSRWIGTTECAALFRSFGLRAMIVDFCCKENECSSSVSASSGDKIIDESRCKRKLIQISGPMDRFVSVGSTSNHGSSASKVSTIPVGKSVHHVLIDWVWNYFSDNSIIKSSNQHVILSEKAPLYFQHDGHSRTIIGIQAKRQRSGMQQFNLLIMDPGHRSEALAVALNKRSGWQKFIKRGVHTLRKPQYQLCYIDSGLASGEEMEKLKMLHSARLEV